MLEEHSMIDSFALGNPDGSIPTFDDINVSAGPSHEPEFSSSICHPDGSVPTGYNARGDPGTEFVAGSDCPTLDSWTSSQQFPGSVSYLSRSTNFGLVFSPDFIFSDLRGVAGPSLEPEFPSAICNPDGSVPTGDKASGDPVTQFVVGSDNPGLDSGTLGRQLLGSVLTDDTDLLQGAAEGQEEKGKRNAAELISNHASPLPSNDQLGDKEMTTSVEHHSSCNTSPIESESRGTLNEEKHQEPKVGMEFSSEEEAFKFYNDYAENIGFKVRKGKKIWSLDKKLIKRYLLCSREGKKQAKKTSKHQKKETRTDCKAMVKFTITNEKWKVSMVKLEHSHELVSPSQNHVSNALVIIDSVNEAGMEKKAADAQTVGFHGEGSKRPCTKEECKLTHCATKKERMAKSLRQGSVAVPVGKAESVREDEICEAIPICQKGQLIDGEAKGSDAEGKEEKEEAVEAEEMTKTAGRGSSNDGASSSESPRLNEAPNFGFSLDFTLPNLEPTCRPEKRKLMTLREWGANKKEKKEKEREEERSSAAGTGGSATPAESEDPKLCDSIMKDMNSALSSVSKFTSWVGNLQELCKQSVLDLMVLRDKLAQNDHICATQKARIDDLEKKLAVAKTAQQETEGRFSELMVQLAEERGKYSKLAADLGKERDSLLAERLHWEKRYQLGHASMIKQAQSMVNDSYRKGYADGHASCGAPPGVN